MNNCFPLFLTYVHMIIYLFICIVVFTEEDCGTVETFVYVLLNIS